MNSRCPHFHGFLWECGQPCVDKQAAAVPRVESGGTPPHTLWTGKALPPSQVVRTTPRSGTPGKADPITAAQVPAIAARPAAADAITMLNANTVFIPD